MRDERWHRSDPLDPGFRLDTSPFFWLTRVSGRYLLHMERRLKSIGMDVPRWRVLMILTEQEPASVSTLSELSVVKLATMTKIVQRMTAAGLVTTITRATDARVTEVAMTIAGREALMRVRTEGSDVFTRAFAAFSGRDIDTLVVDLQRLFAGLDSR